MAHVPGDIPLLIAGTGPEEPRLRALAAGDPRIRFLGFVRRPPARRPVRQRARRGLRARGRGLGLITLEAMGCGTPVVTCTDSGGPTELVADGVTGLVAEPEPPSLGAGPRPARRTNPCWPPSLGRAGKRRAARVTWRRRVRRLLDERRRRPDRARQRAEPVGRRPGRTGARGAQPAEDRRHGNVPGRPASRRRTAAVSATSTARCPRHADVEIVSPGRPAPSRGHDRLGPGLAQTLVPRSPTRRHRRGAEQRGAHAGDRHRRRPPTSGATPAYLDELRPGRRAVQPCILAEPYLLPAVEQAGLDLPFIYDAFNVEADLKARPLSPTPVGRELLAAVVESNGGRSADRRRRPPARPRTPTALAARYGRHARGLRRDPERHRHRGPGRPPRPSGRRRQRDGASGSPRPASTAAGRPTSHCSSPAGTRRTSMPPNCHPRARPPTAGRAVPARRQPRRGVHATGSCPATSCSPAWSPTGPRQRCSDVSTWPSTRCAPAPGTNLKVIEYLAAGVPAVSTPFGVRGLDVVDGDPPAASPARRRSPARSGRRSTIPPPPIGGRRPAGRWPPSAMTGSRSATASGRWCASILGPAPSPGSWSAEVGVTAGGRLRSPVQRCMVEDLVDG